MSEFSEAFIAIMDYVESQGATNLKDVEGCWESEVDDHWWIALNGHTKDANCTKGVPVDPYCCYIEFNGWPAGQINAFGGRIVVGEAANEDSFIDALHAATEKSAQDTPSMCGHCGAVDPVKAELLDALRELWSCAETYGEFNDPQHDWFSLRYQVQDAITKAEGRA